jgi:hypothetical protein
MSNDNDTYANLLIAGVATQEIHFENLIQSFGKFITETDLTLFENPHSRPLLNEIAFETIDYGEIPQIIEKELKALNLSYIWSWGSAYDVEEGIYINDPRTKYFKQRHTAYGKTYLPFEDIKNPKKIKNLKEFEKKKKELSEVGFYFAPTAHAIMTTVTKFPMTSSFITAG